MRVLVDTNVLGRISRSGHAMLATAVQAVKALRGGQYELRVVPQIIYEYWVVATRPANQNGLGLTIKQAETNILAFKPVFPPLRDERGLLERWEALVVAHRVQGKPSHDARLVVAMERHGLSRLLTFNAKDFPRFGNVQILDPLLVVSSNIVP
jgi:predicted nucleic acid-binding protein